MYFSMSAGERERDVADVVEAIARVVGRKGGGGFEIEAGEIADGVVVFEAIEAAGGDPAGVVVGAFVVACVLGGEPFAEGFDFGGGRDRATFGWHFTVGDFGGDFVPDVLFGENFFGGGEALEVETAELGFGVVAHGAVPVEVGLDVLAEAGLIGGEQRGACEEEESEDDTHHSLLYCRRPFQRTWVLAKQRASLRLVSDGL